MIYIPLFSILSLLTVTVYLTLDAFQIVFMDVNEELFKEDVPVSYLYGFAISNLLVDVASSTLFYWRGYGGLLSESHAHYNCEDSYQVVPTDDVEANKIDSLSYSHDHDHGHDHGHHHAHVHTHVSNMSESVNFDEIATYSHDHVHAMPHSYLSPDSSQIDSSPSNFLDHGHSHTHASQATSSCASCPSEAYSPTNTTNTIESIHCTITRKLNLNMLSALTHVGGDTLRSTSVLIAAIISSVSSSPYLTSTRCDAWAAIIVTILVFFTSIPLLISISTFAYRDFVMDDFNLSKRARSNTNNDVLLGDHLLKSFCCGSGECSTAGKPCCAAAKTPACGCASVETKSSGGCCSANSNSNNNNNGGCCSGKKNCSSSSLSPLVNQSSSSNYGSI